MGRPPNLLNHFRPYAAMDKKISYGAVFGAGVICRRASGVEPVCGELQADRITTERMTKPVVAVFIPALLDKPVPGSHLVQSRPDIRLQVRTGVLRAEFRPG